MFMILGGVDGAASGAFQAMSVVQAIEKALQLMGAGLKGVHIKDPEGIIYTHQQFDDLLMKWEDR
ncbi:hypothetical protein [Afipia clevelandensis]|uniref:Uncharacterized protein n=1 Tax=Afipia clevelandensis ATCC 49720 TaxID=883079 RepID=K8PA78_9BRAD|nr:hypothetical protein [Afipia clevelandensis]EKS37679.1 hypothetical protein HMPREF9696_01629 [Afipia clevelandensis ATCC 49720]